MHIPNGLLDPKVSAGAAFAAAGVLGYCISRVRQALSRAVPASILAGAGNFAVNISERSKKTISSLAESHLMKMGAVGSLIFSAQMFNFPVAEGTSGHLLGGILAALCLGPFSGTVVISAVLAVQSIFLGDGGISALGANIFNMAIIGTLLSYYIYYAVNRIFKGEKGFVAGVMLASFASVFLASAACSFEIVLSGTSELGRIFPIMAAIHARIGVAEGLITLMAVNLLLGIKFGLEGKITDDQ